MKLFSAIMSIYLLGLMFVPCADGHTENKDDNTKIETLSSQENHIDTCSPFCFCECCQTISQQATYNYFSYFASLIGTVVPYVQASEYSVPISFWQPPKI
jgi:hypothetical protein